MRHLLVAVALVISAAFAPTLAAVAPEALAGVAASPLHVAAVVAAVVARLAAWTLLPVVVIDAALAWALRAPGSTAGRCDPREDPRRCSASPRSCR